MKKFFENWKTIYLSLISDHSLSPKFQRICLSLIILGCLSIRLVSIDSPTLDRTRWKEIDYIEISKNYSKNGYNFFKPEISWPAEPPRVTPMELPVVPYIASFLYPVFGINIYTVRLITLISFLLLPIYIFLLCKREIGPFVALIAAVASAMMPLFNKFGNFLFSEPLMILMSVVAIYHFAQWIEHRRRSDWFIALIGFTLAISLKLTPLYLLLPLSWIVFREYRFDVKKYKNFLIFIMLALILPTAWYTYAYYLTKNSIDVFGIFQGHDKMQTFAMLSSPEWYMKMIYRISCHILGGTLGSLLCLLGFGTIFFNRKADLFFAYFFAIIIFFIIVAEGNFDAPYRQLTLIPPGSVLVAMGTLAVLSLIKALTVNISFSKLTLRIRKLDILLCFAIILLIPLEFMILSTILDPMKPYRPRNWEFAKEIRKYANSSTKLVCAGEYTIHKGGYDLSPEIYYYTGLQGWTLLQGDWNIEKIKELIGRGATLFVAIAMDREPDSNQFIDRMKHTYRTLYANNSKDWLLLDLTKNAAEIE